MRAGVALIVAVLALGLGATVAGAKKQHGKKGHAWGSKVMLAHPSPARLSGSVNSSLAACRKHRLVNVFYTDPGSATTTLLSVQRTDGKGRYEVNLPQAAFPGTYQAQAVKQRIRARKSPQTCKAAVSGILGL